MEWLRRLLTGPKTESLTDKAARIASRSDEVIVAEAQRLAPLLSQIIDEVGHGLAPGMTTRDVASALERRVRNHDLFPAMLGYNDFPAAAAISVNEQIVNGVPSSRRIADGDIVSIELSAASDQGYNHTCRASESVGPGLGSGWGRFYTST